MMNEYSKDLKEAIEKMMTLIENTSSEVNTYLQELKKIVATRADKKKGKKPTYATATKKCGSVIVMNPTITQNSKETREDVRNHIKPVDLRIGILNTKSINNGGVAIVCKNE
ncbi:hypothetical protein HHI36_019864 [Cryptolaemus montrouzieri]|uniref:Phage protein n=1 Tax=Cryptolaemus montrouzieri TaxID=559131 RepID=A0ABD2N8M5_9CUCU